MEITSRRDGFTVKILIFGAGVIGSVYGAKLKEAGHDVTVVARGQRLRDLSAHGILLEEFESGKTEATPVRVLDAMPTQEAFDLCVVSLQWTQVEDALPDLASNPHIPAFLFLHNTVFGFQPLIDALGKSRVLIGHANLGGERVGPTVHFLASQKMTLAELDGTVSPRLQAFAEAFQGAGFGVEFSGNPDAWKKYHMALGCPMVNAMYRAGSCNYQLSQDRESLDLFIDGFREAVDILQSLDISAEPRKMRLVARFPKFMLRALFRKVFALRIMDIGGARHARNAREEMAQLSQDFLTLADRADHPAPVLRKLHNYAIADTPSGSLRDGRTQETSPGHA